MSSFMECDACRSKPGTPALCAGCLRNRTTISQFELQAEAHKATREESDQRGSELAAAARRYDELKQLWNDLNRSYQKLSHESHFMFGAYNQAKLLVHEASSLAGQLRAYVAAADTDLEERVCLEWIAKLENKLLEAQRA